MICRPAASLCKHRFRGRLCFRPEKSPHRGHQVCPTSPHRSMTWHMSMPWPKDRSAALWNVTGRPCPLPGWKTVFSPRFKTHQTGMQKRPRTPRCGPEPRPRLPGCWTDTDARMIRHKVPSYSWPVSLAPEDLCPMFGCFRDLLPPSPSASPPSDLLPDGPSFITRVCGFGFHIPRSRFGQARRARSPQIAQALDALVRVSCFPAMNGV